VELTLSLSNDSNLQDGELGHRVAPEAGFGKTAQAKSRSCASLLGRHARRGIVDTRKVLHSLRHRAQDRLWAAERPQDTPWALLGHEETTVAEDYCIGFSVLQLKRWIEKIGF
jgi:hypothetical protein